MATKTKVYVDTSAFIAFFDRSDSYHTHFAQLFADPPPFVTTSLVVMEGHGWFLRRYDATKAKQFLNFFETLPRCKVIPVGSRELHQASSVVGDFIDQPLTLADALGLWIMRRERISCCWSTDRHLGLTGVPLVIHQI